MDFTMLTKMTRLGRLLARKHERDSDLHDKRPVELQTLDEILDPNIANKAQDNKEMDEAQLAEFFAKSTKVIARPTYDLLLAYFATIGDQRLSFYGVCNADGSVTLPHPDYHHVILPHRAKVLKGNKIDKRMYSRTSSHLGNSLIQFYEPGTRRHQGNNMFTGTIVSVLQMPIDGFFRTFLLVRKHRPLDVACHTNHPELNTQVIYSEPVEDVIVIEPVHVITHLTALKRSSSTFNTTEPVLVVCTSLNRGRR